jgi:hypothetical protein
MLFFRLSSWSDVDAISSYRDVFFLRLAHIPLFSGKGASEVRPVVIARVPALALFNGSGVSPRERLDAEKSYVRMTLLEKSKVQGPEEEASFSAQHPRFVDLSAKYATEFAASSAVADTGSSMVSDMVNVTIHNVSFSSASGRQHEPITRKLPSSLTISRFKLIIKQVFGLDPFVQQLSFRDYKDSVPTMLDDDEATLRYFGVSDGSHIYVNEADAA